MNIINWITGRLSEVSTYTGLIGTVATTVTAIVFHRQLSATDAGTIGTVIAGVISGGLIAVSTKNPTALVSTVVADIPEVIHVAEDLKAQAHVALASGEPAKYSALMANAATKAVWL